MRIARLDLAAFGPFTNARLDFAHRPQALQLVYGPNEAGKSTTLRAVIALLYGIPARTTDAHVHEMTKLRIGGVLLDEHGGRHEVVRRKGLRNTLLTSKEKALPDDAIASLLGGLDEALFRQMFGLDHERLRQGAEALLAHGGNLGEGLFDAGTGARSIRATLHSLAQEADALFRPRGRTPRLNAAIDQLREHLRAQRDAALSPQAFVEQQQALVQAREARASYVAKRRILFEEKAWLTRAINLIPLLARKASLETEPRSHKDSDEPLDAWEAEHKALAARFQASRRAEAELPHDQARAERLAQEVLELRTKVLSAGELQATLDTPTRTRLRKLVERHESLVRETEQLARLEQEQKQRQRAWADKLPSEEPQAPLTLAALLDRIEREGPERTLLALELELAEAERSVTQRARALGLSAALGDLATLELPEDQALAELEREATEIAQRARRCAERQSELEERGAELERMRDLLLSEGSPASLEDLERVRSRRDHTLQRLKTTPAQAQLLDADLATLEATIALSDELSDRLRREADQVLKLARIEAESRALGRERATMAELQEQVQHERSLWEEAASHALDRMALSPSDRERRVELKEAPALLDRGRIIKLTQLREQAAQILSREAACRVVRARVLDAASTLEALLAEEAAAPVREAVLASEQPAAQRLTEAYAAGKAELALRLTRRQDFETTRNHWEESRLALDGTRARLEHSTKDLDMTRAQVVEELTRLGLSASLAPEEVLASLDELVELERMTRELRGLRARISDTTTELASLKDDIRALAIRLAPEFITAPSPDSESVPEHDAAVMLETLEQKLRRQRDARRDHEERLRELTKLEEQLAQFGDGATSDELRRKLHDVAPDTARARLAEIDGEIELLHHEIAALDQAIGSKEAGLNLLEQPSGAVAIAEEVQSDLSSVRQLVRRYLELRLSQTLLKREVDTYRAKHQGPVLARASELFPRLTLNRYRGLDVEFDERDEAVLCAVRTDGKTVRVAGLSDGTRDQLYLALRVASIERFLEKNAPFPLILDDAFVHFDDQRAQAAIEVLSELGGRTQVLLFTHHQRMVDLARAALGQRGLVLHELDPARGVINLRDDGPLFAGL